jgi:uncharacterized 2Fe-2S/4Fe-4S cluster protein (DUF4445 family)
MPRNLTVVFEPEGKTATVTRGATVLEAARQTGIGIRSECGGEGTCGKCRVIVKEQGTPRRVTRVEKKFLSAEEIRRGYRLACQTKIFRNSRILLPPETRLKSRKIQTEGYERPVRLNPSLEKFHVKLRKPTLSDFRPDLERLLDAVGKMVPDSYKLEIDLATLRNLPTTIREANWSVTVTKWADKKIIDIEPGDTHSEYYGFAVDMGTSKIVGHLVDLKTGETVSTGSAENPQFIHGEDVISRITYATKSKANLETLQKLAIKGINDVLQATLTEADVNPRNIGEVIVVGNTAMHHLLLGIEPKHLALSPFTPAVKKQVQTPARELGIKTNPQAIVSFPPIVAGFVGADAVADAIAVGLHETSRISMLIDIGTNTEILVGNKDDLLSCSCASGPAFEGAHIKHGMKAITGAIEKFRIRSGNLKIEYETIGNVKPTGICGSGMIDVTAELLRHSVIDRRGRFVKGTKTDRLRKRRKDTGFLIASKNETGTGGEITVSQRDISEIQLAKAAVHTGSSILLMEKQVGETELENVFVAGAFGNYLNIENSKYISMLPKVPTGRIAFVGNAAIVGAKSALKSKKTRKNMTALSERIRYLELANHPDFSKQFMKALYLA